MKGPPDILWRDELTLVKDSGEASGAALKKWRTLLGCWMRFFAACSGEVKRLFLLPWKSLKLLVPSSSSYDWPGMMACCLDTLTEKNKQTDETAAFLNYAICCWEQAWTCYCHYIHRHAAESMQACRHMKPIADLGRWSWRGSEELSTANTIPE